MRNANVPYELVEEYCQAILNAQSEEESAEVQREIYLTLEKEGLGEATVQNFFVEANAIIQNGEEGLLVYDENGKIIMGQHYKEIRTETTTPEEIPTVNNKLENLEKASILYGIVIPTVAGLLLIKQKLLARKKEKNNNLSK